MLDEILKLSRRSSRNEEQFNLWGKEAAKRFIEEGVPLNTSVEKTAAEHGLNSDEINRVVEAANLETYGHFLKTSQDKTFEFPVADAKEIVGFLGSSEKTAMPVVFVTDYEATLPAEMSKVATADIFEAFGVSPEMEKVASPKRLENLVEKLDLALEITRDKLAALSEKFVENAEDFYKNIKQEVLKGKSFDEVAVALKAKAGDSPHAGRLEELLGWAKNRLHDDGSVLPPVAGVKKAEPVELDKITDLFESPQVPVQVINGRHKLFGILDTLVDQFDEADKYRNKLHVIQDKVKYVKRRTDPRQVTA